MKIELELPEWITTERRGIFVMAGIELAAHKISGYPWKIKTSRCSNCGRCCLKLKRSGEFFNPTDGRCMYLKDDGNKKICNLGMGRPWGCCVYVSAIPECTERYEEIK